MLFRSLIAAVVFIAVTLPAAAERRVALVLGNGAYKSAPKLANPARDAEAVAAMLKRQDFEVVLAIDQDREGMFAAIDRFAELARGADAALFYYAGHGLQIDNKNLLVPIEAQIRSELDATRKTVEVDTVLNQTMSDAKVKIVLLDACRENPFSTDIANDQQKKTRNITVKGGLAEMKPGKGSIIQFATAAGALAVDGKQGENSPFTKALLKHLSKPDLEIQHALTMVRGDVAEETGDVQEPWYKTNITGFFFMKGSQAAALPSALQPTAPAATASAAGNDGQKEVLFWETIKASTSPDDFKAYLDQYPNGTYAGLARNRIAQIQKPAVVAALPTTTSAETRAIPPQVTRQTASAEDLRSTEANAASEDAIGLSRDAWKEVQTRLSALGLRKGSIDGKPGDVTRASVKTWQNTRGYMASGYLNKIQHDSLLGEQISAAALAKVTRGDDDGDTSAAQQPAAAPRRQARQSSGGGNNSGGGGNGGNSAGEVIFKEVIKQGVGAIGRKMGVPW
jgi:uncharacterized caspase-like protein